MTGASGVTSCFDLYDHRQERRAVVRAAWTSGTTAPWDRIAGWASTAVHFTSSILPRSGKGDGSRSLPERGAVLASNYPGGGLICPKFWRILREEELLK